ncbi:MAG: Tn3 family transposase [Pseudomonadota bacterium]
MQPSDTAYPRLKSNINASDLAHWYTPSPEELIFCDSIVRGPNTRLGFLLALKTFQRLGYFLTSNEIPDAIIEHIASIEEEIPSRALLQQYDQSRSRKTHVGRIRKFLDVKTFNNEARQLLMQTLREVALLKEDLADIVNVGIEVLVRHRYELPAFSTLVREARSQRASANQILFSAVYDRLHESGRVFLDQLYVVGDNPSRTSPWNDLKRDAPKATLDGLRSVVAHYDELTALSHHVPLLFTIPVAKLNQLALEGMSLDAARMADMESQKRYTMTLALIKRQLARVAEDLCDMFCKQMLRAQHKAEEELREYLTANQEKTDEILRRFAQLETVLNSDGSMETQLTLTRQLVTSRPDLCEFSRVHAEHGGKNECRFMWGHFKARRAELLRILGKLRFVATSHDKSIERALAFIQSNQRRQTAWLSLNEQLTPNDLSWIPDKWRKLVFGENHKATPTQINRRHFEVCVCLQLVQELKSGDICVPVSDAYADYRDQLLSTAECARTREEYGEQVGLPVCPELFVSHLQGLLAQTALAVDEGYPNNAHFKITDGRAVLSPLTKKPIPPGFQLVDNALSRKLQSHEISILDVLCDTMQWLNWGCHFGPLSGHESKLRDEAYRQILTTFAYGTGLGPTQVAKSVAGISDRQIAFINQRHVTSDKLEAAIREAINGYNRFWLPKYWGDTWRAAADGTQWDLYENNLLSERHIRYGGYGGVAYYHVSDTYIALFSHFIPCGVWEAVYILDGLIKNDSDIQADTVHGDTQAQSTPVFGLAFLLGIKLMPRIRNWKDLKCYKADSEEAYRYIDDLFTKERIDWELIALHLPDMLQVAQSIKAGRIAPSTILRKLGTASRKNKLYYAFRELGRVVRTIFLLEYIGSEELRRIIQGATNKCEGFNKFAQWVYFAADQIQENVRDEQLKIIKYNHLIANLLIFHNCRTMTQALKELEDEGTVLTPEILAAMNLYRTGHLSRFGAYELRDRAVEPIDYDVRLAVKPKTRVKL